MEKMSVVNLMILGFLMERPMSAYEMAQVVDGQLIGELMKISAPAIYKNVKQLSQDGDVTVETVKAGEMPEKKVYTITAAGQQYFHTLMEHYAGTVMDYYFEFNAMLLNLDKVDKATGLALLGQLRAQLEQAHGWVVEHEQHARAMHAFFPGLAMVKQARMVMGTLVEWVHETIAEYQATEEMGRSLLDHHPPSSFQAQQ
jgi:DNA-binding PadR family transcriptional regulator